MVSGQIYHALNQIKPLPGLNQAGTYEVSYTLPGANPKEANGSDQKTKITKTLTLTVHPLYSFVILKLYSCTVSCSFVELYSEMYSSTVLQRDVQLYGCTTSFTVVQ